MPQRPGRDRDRRRRRDLDGCAGANRRRAAGWDARCQGVSTGFRRASGP